MFGKDPSSTGGYENKNPAGTNFLRSTVRALLYSGDSFYEEKLTQFQLNWKFYNNRHWSDNNDELLSFNYVRAVIDKVNNFMAGKNGFEVNVVDDYGDEVPTEIEKPYEALLNYNWRKNNKMTFLQKKLQMGGICGDCYVFLSPNVTKGFIQYTLLDSRKVVPIFKDGNHDEVLGYRVVKQLVGNDKQYIIQVTEYTIGMRRTFYQKSTGVNSEKFEVENSPNSLDFIPIVHIVNTAMSEGYGGKSDVDDIIKLNKIFNEMAEDVKTVIDYYVEPTTIVTGGTLGQVARGLNQIWSGLPSDANVFNLTLGEDMGNSLNFLKLLKEAIHDMTGVPEEVLSKVQHISNTSAAALQMLFQPLILAADKKSVTYGEGIQEINRMTCILYNIYLRNHPLFQMLPDEAKAEKAAIFFDRYKTDVIWKYNLPTDRQAMLNESEIEVRLGLGSKKEVMERLGKKNISLIEQQVKEDRDAEIDYQGRLAKASATPNPMIQEQVAE